MRKILFQSGIAIVLGALIFLSGENLGLFPGILIPTSVILLISGVIGMVLGFIIKTTEQVNED